MAAPNSYHHPGAWTPDQCQPHEDDARSVYTNNPSSYAYPYNAYHPGNSTSSLQQHRSQPQYPAYGSPSYRDLSGLPPVGYISQSDVTVPPTAGASTFPEPPYYVPPTVSDDHHHHPSAAATASYSDQPFQSMLARTTITPPHTVSRESPPYAVPSYSFAPNYPSAGAGQHDLSPHPPPATAHVDGAMQPTRTKRQRSDTGAGFDGPGTEEISPVVQFDLVSPPSADKFKRACARCKNLKVRCQFKDDQESCVRCLKGSHECLIPGRKIRRPPPKREVLLSKIREQASKIDDLMSQLENLQSADRQTARMESELSNEFAISANTAEVSPKSHASAISSPREVASTSSGPGSSVNKEHLEWIAEARQNLEAFGGFIALGGASTNRAYFVAEALEDSASSEDEFGLVVDGGSESDTEEPRKRERGVGAVGKMASIPTGASPFGLMARLSAQKSRALASSKKSSSVASDVSDLGVAHEDFFRPSPDPDSFRPGSDWDGHEVPLLLKKNIITPMEAEKLFNMYFAWMNPSVSLLDPKLYTPQQVYWRSPFLFTTICAIASRYDTERPDLYPTAMQYARQSAGAAFLGGDKRVEIVQAYILLSLYPIPARRWEDDRCWIYLGQAIRMAMDMNLHHPNTARAQNEQHDREMLNRTRAWLNCFNLDRSMGSQYGKTIAIRNTDFVANHSGDWWHSSKHNMEHFDIHLCAYNNELRILVDFMMKVYSDPSHPTGFNRELDLGKLAGETDDQIQALRDEWFTILDRTDTSDQQNRFRIGLLKLAYSYARLVALSVGFQHQFSKGHGVENPFLERCIRAASDVVSAMVDDIGRPEQRKYVRMGPDAQTVFVAFSCTFLIKLLQPKYASYLTPEQREHITKIVQRAVDFLSSPDIFIDDRHGPRLYSRFISGLLDHVKNQPAVAAGRTRQRLSKLHSVAPSQSRSQSHGEQEQTRTHPQTTHALSEYYPPLPPRASTPFDHFAISIEVNHFTAASAPADQQLYNPRAMDASTFFNSPLPFDNEMLQSMQSVSSLENMHDTMMPGFAWMGQLPPMNTSYGFPS
ncbi:hypothetical protein OF83DRAFT_189903 [Amylostereum chailletii]|nr:hypothetical protein OF83DRAFT_189903 [Amylostereum chailletii]